MARMFPAICPATMEGGAVGPAERQLFTRLTRELDAGWQIIHRSALFADGDSRSPDFVLLHRDYGVALLSVATPGETDDPAVAMAAMGARLEVVGFARRYPGHLAIVARRVVPGAVSDLAAFLAVRFAAVAVSAIADPTWPDWLLQRLAPGRRTEDARTEDARAAVAAELGLRAPTPDDSWRAWAGDKPRGAPDIAPPPPAMPGAPIAAERIPVSRDVTTRSPLWTGMLLSVVVVAIVLVGIAVLSHGNGPHDLVARQSITLPSQSPPAASPPASSN